MVRRIEVELVGDSSSLEKAFGRVSKSGNSLGKTLGKGLKLAALGAGAAVAGFAGILKVGFDELAESQKVTAQTNAVLKSTGRIANVTGHDVEGLANHLSALSGVDDEVIRSGENLLLTFTNIRNNTRKNQYTFNDATKAALDMSVAMGTDLRNASILVGKALNDPLRGMTALRRVGVSFSKAQEEAIKKLVETGDVAGAQRIILRELNKEFGGSAKAAGNTLPGQLNKLRNKFDELAANIAAKLLPTINQFLEWTNKHWPQISAAITTGANIISTAIGGITTAVRFVVDFFRTHWGTIGPIISQVVTVVQAQFARLVAYWNGTLLPAIQNIIQFARALWKRFGDDIKRNLQSAIVIVRALLNVIKGIFEVVLAVIRGDWSAAWSGIKAILRNALTALVAIVRNFKNNFFAAAKAIGVAVKNGVVAGVSGLASALVGVIRSAVNSVIAVIRRFRIGFPGINPPGPGSIPGFSVQPFSGIPSIATGGDITRSGIAMVHRGERVQPARVANRGGGMPGGPVMVLTTREIAAWLQEQNVAYARSNGGRSIF